MWKNLPSDYDLKMIVDRPFTAKDSINDQQLVYMAQEILDYHKLIEVLKKGLGLDVVEDALKIGTQYDDD